MNELNGLLLGSTYSRRRASEAPKLNFPDEIVRVFGQIRREERWQPTLVALPALFRYVLEAESPQILAKPPANESMSCEFLRCPASMKVKAEVWWWSTLGSRDNTALLS